MKRLELRLLAAAVLSAAALAIPAASASAVDGPLRFFPGTGSDATPMWVVTAEPCPAAAQAIIGTVTGPGFPAEGYVVLSNTKAGLDYTKAMTLALQDTFNGFAASSGGIKLQGKYVVTVRCIDRLGATTFATFTGTVTFASPKKYTAPAAVITEVPKDTGGIDGGSIPGQPAAPSEPAPSASGAATEDPSAAPSAAGSAAATPGPETSADPLAPPAEAPLAGAAAGQERDGGSSSPVQVLALALGAALVVGGLVALVRGGRRESAVDSAPLDELVPTHADGK
jgi:hypothetical protein